MDNLCQLPVTFVVTDYFVLCKKVKKKEEEKVLRMITLLNLVNIPFNNDGKIDTWPFVGKRLASAFALLA